MDNNYAIGQVAVLAFAATPEQIRGTPDDLKTVLICEPKENRDPFVKLPGGMIEEVKDGDAYRDETPQEAASRELLEETGVVCPPKNFKILHRGYRDRMAPHLGQFPVYLMLGHSADFSGVFDPKKGRLGENREIVIVSRFGNIFISGFAWDIPTQQDVRAEFFPVYRDMLHSAGLF